MNQYQWISPTGNLSPSYGLEDLISQILQGKAFPPQELIINQTPPSQVAAQLAELQDAWFETMPLLQPFSEGTGEVNHFIFGKILAQVAMNRFTGFLSVNESKENLFYSLRFLSGHLIEINAYDPSTDLGQILVQRGLIAQNQLQTGIEINRSTGGSIGKTLISAGFMSESDLNQALAEQMFARVRRIAKLKTFYIKLRPSELASQNAAVARISGYGLLEIYLGYALEDEEIKGYMNELLAKPLQVNWQSAGMQLLSREDALYLKQLEAKKSLAPLAKHPRWTQRNSALKCIVWDFLGVIEQGDDLLEEILYQVSQQDVYEALKLPTNVPFSRVLLEQKIREIAIKAKLSEPAQGKDGKLKELIEQRLRSLSDYRPDPGELFVLERMKKMGLNLNDQDTKRDLLYDYHVQQGESCLKKQKYQDAYDHFNHAIVLRDPKLSLTLNLIWSKFLASPKKPEDHLSAIKAIEKQISIHPQSPEPLLILAQIKKTMGELKEAEIVLKNLLKLDPSHPAAQAELRILFSREYDQKRGGSLGMGINTGDFEPLLYTLFATLLCFGLIWFVALNLPNSERAHWPEIAEIDSEVDPSLSEIEKKAHFNQSLRKSYRNESLILAAYQLGLEQNPAVKGSLETGLDFSELPDIYIELNRSLEFLGKKQLIEVKNALARSLIIPINQQVMGNVEAYLLIDDLFAWGRRIILLLIGIAGYWMLRQWYFKKTPTAPPFLSWGLKIEDFAWLLIALILAAVVGFLSPNLQSPTPQPYLAGLVALNTLSEDLFFLLFVYSALQITLKDEPYIKIGIFAVCFMLYRFTFFAVWQLDSTWMWTIVLQGGFLIGAILALIKEKTQSVSVVIIAHLIMKLIPSYAILF